MREGDAKWSKVIEIIDNKLRAWDAKKRAIGNGA